MMYRFLDRLPQNLDEHFHFMIGAMRQWTAAARGGRCPCGAVVVGFSWRGVTAALPDFNEMMALLDTKAARWLRFGMPGAEHVTADEAALLSMFAAALGGEVLAVRRIAATLLADHEASDAGERMAKAAEWMALRFVQAPLTQRD
ncbi:hypothetical protein [Sphingomonas sp. Leaf231]|uniref:hypothetical protein n=1 Tax=Sphingomonas sp. Leaf231 TaxID=1736301 RepID=UPI0012E26F11|nr:hypothetical protein [Sphingomonas sp. Leaf231]